MRASPRTNFSSPIRKAALTRADRRCEADFPWGERCPCILRPGYYRFDHIIPDAIGGSATLENCQVICVDCDAAKYPSDRVVIDRTRRVQDRHEGTRTVPRRPMAGGRRSDVKRTLGGQLVFRATGALASRPASIDVRSL
ncbi:HNH endonuclease [Methylobacterium sp. E-041]|uniref:HNH endonuclease n=1 Tax=Methylobacterium sp. E-041 TaxID=2836573 RepID=UPI001FB922C8|nr:HNH endonuclease signature motif containing protein [Methylobacterium sp. E-041]MCJ2104727.1 HNH endonuclease [Methylobacterium sp. E-041]